MGLLNKFREGLAKTRQGLERSFSRLLPGSKPLDLNLLESLEEVLIETDLGAKATDVIISELRQDRDRGLLRGKDRKGEIDLVQLKEYLKREILKIFEGTQKTFSKEPLSSGTGEAKPHTILMVGVNGVGKTTTIGKLAARFQTEGRKVLLAAGDTFRAAAIGQLQIWASRTQCEVVAQQPGSDPSAVVFDALVSAKARQIDELIVDTAGRLHTKSNLMEELRKIKRVMNKAHPGSPHEVLLVLDATTGQNALQQARMFHETVGITGIVLTKLDGSAKGGIIAAVAKELKLPIYFVCVGEGTEDLLPFDPSAFVEGLLA